MFGQTQSMTIESAELPQFFQHLASVVPIYKRPFFVKSGSSGDLHLYWAHSPHRRHGQAHFLLSSQRGRKEGKATVWWMGAFSLTLLGPYRKHLDMEDRFSLSLMIHQKVASSYLPTLVSWPVVPMGTFDIISEAKSSLYRRKAWHFIKKS